MFLSILVVTMAEFLELPDWEGTSFGVGEVLPPGTVRPQRTTPPLAVGQAIPAKDHLMEKAERADDDVIRARERKEQDNARRLAMKRAAGEGSSAGVKRRRQTVLDVTAGAVGQEDVISADPLNQANPSGGAGGGDGGANVQENVQEEGNIQEAGDENVPGGGPDHATEAGGANVERPPTPPVLQSPGHASDGKLSHLGIFVLGIHTFLSFLLILFILFTARSVPHPGPEIVTVHSDAGWFHL